MGEPFLHFDKFDDFNSKKLSANEENTKYTIGVDGAVTSGSPDIPWDTICWIKDESKIWTHGKLYDCSAIPTKVSQLDNDSGYIKSLSKGNVADIYTAQKLMCDIEINGNTITPKKFSGSVGNPLLPVYIGDGKPTPITSFPEAYLSWGGKNFAGSYGPIDAALVDVLRANRFDGLPAECITVEYSRDGGATWLDYGATDKQKVDMVSQTPGNASLYIGKNDTDNPVNANHKLRVIINSWKANRTQAVYTRLEKFVILISSSDFSYNTTCTIKTRTRGDYLEGNDTWKVVKEALQVSGWSGYNVIPCVVSPFGANNPTLATSIGEIMFEFSIGNPPSSGIGLSVVKIFAYGGMGWATSSNMAAGGHLYSYDYQQNAKFPSKVNAVGGLQENGTNLSAKYLGINAAAKSISDGTNSYTPSAIKTMETNLEDVISYVVSIDTSLFPTSTDEVIGFRQTNGGDGVGYSEAWLDRLKGNTVVWNQVVNISNVVVQYDKNLYTITRSDGLIEVSKSEGGSTSSDSIFVYYAHNFIASRRYLIVYNLKRFDGQNTGHRLNGNGIYDGSKYHDLIDVNGTDYKFFSPTESFTSKQMQIPQTVTAGVALSYTLRPVIYDLTQMFGAGNEPTTIEEFNARKPLGVSDAYNEGELISTTADEIKSVGFNAWDEEWEMGAYDDSNGDEINTNTHIRNVAPIKVLPNMAYEFCGPTKFVFWYDADMNFISPRIQASKNTTHTSPANAAYMNFYVYQVTEYNHDICIHLVHTGTRNGQYEPYKEYRLPLPIKDIKDKDGNQLFPNGLLSAGTAYDEITATKAIKRIGVRAYQDGDTWTDGVNTYYELAEPIEVDIDEWDRSYDVSDFGTEEVIFDTPTTPLKADIIYEYNAKGRIEANERGIEELNDKLAEMNEKVGEMNGLSISADKIWSEENPVDITLGDVDNDAFLPEGYGLAGGQSRVARMYVKFTSTATTYEGEFMSSYNDNCLIIGVKGYYELLSPNGTMLKRGYVGDSCVKVEQIGNSGWKFNFAALDMEEGMNVRVGAILEYIDID